MKLITAIIRESRLDHVREALIDVDITRLTVSRVSGHGQQIKEEIYRGRRVVPNLTPKIRLEIAVNDEFVDIACKTIIDAAKTNGGTLGDGKILITQLEDCIRIRTEERGGKAI